MTGCESQNMRTRTIVIVEVGILLGLFVSIFLLPRNLPISTFVLIAISIEIGANVYLFGKKRQPLTHEGGYRMTPRAYLGLGLVIFFWILHFLWR
jgi:hypothetical protein